MPVNAWEYSFNGLTFGGNTIYGVLQVTGLASPPPTKSDIKQKVTTHGAFVFGNYYEEKHIIIDGDIAEVSAAALEGSVAAWRAAFAATSSDLPLLYRLGGSQTRRVNCRCMRRNIVVDEFYELGIARWTVELVAGDPGIYTEDGITKLFNG